MAGFHLAVNFPTIRWPNVGYACSHPLPAPIVFLREQDAALARAEAIKAQAERQQQQERAVLSAGPSTTPSATTAAAVVTTAAADVARLPSVAPAPAPMAASASQSQRKKGHGRAKGGAKTTLLARDENTSL